MSVERCDSNGDNVYRAQAPHIALHGATTPATAVNIVTEQFVCAPKTWIYNGDYGSLALPSSTDVDR
jgi:hypothetical protein